MDPAPLLAELAADPDAVEHLSDEEVADVLAALERVRARVWLRLNRPPEPNGAGPRDETPEEDQLLGVARVAEIMDVDERYVYDHADDWPFTRRISPRKLRFSERGLFRWLETRE